MAKLLYSSKYGLTQEYYNRYFWISERDPEKRSCIKDLAARINFLIDVGFISLTIHPWNTTLN